MNLYKHMKPQIITGCSVLAILSVLLSGFNYNTMKEKEKMERLSFEINKQARIAQEEKGKIMGKIMGDSMEMAYSQLLQITPNEIRNFHKQIDKQEAIEKEIKR